MVGVAFGKKRGSGRRRKLAALVGVFAYALIRAPSSTETAVANGDTRTLTFVNNHTNEQGSFTYRVNGAYDESVLEKLNWFMRDWRLNEQTKMDPRLFDILWEVYREAGSSAPIDVLSAYRSPQTNAMLRRRSRLVAEHSQHMQGKAVDAHFMDLGVAQARDVAMRMQEGGVGFYPIGNTPWIHVDSGTVRYWPRMSRASLARLFPDGKTVFIPADGQPMDRYAEAKAMIEARGGEVQTASGGGGLFGWLFGGARGGGADDEEETSGARVIASGRGGAPVALGRGSAPAAVALIEPVAAKPEPPPAPNPAPAPPPPAPPPPPVEAVATLEPSGAEPADAPATDEADPAPAPPRKRASLAEDDAPAVPLPPKRPNRLTIPQAPARGAPSGDDLIATLIERKALPTAITKDVHSTPKSALALVEARSTGASAEALTRAATLAFPPLPPARPKPAREDAPPAKEAEAAPLPPPRPAKSANPYGGLITEGFGASAPPKTRASAADD